MTDFGDFGVARLRLSKGFAEWPGSQKNDCIFAVGYLDLSDGHAFLSSIVR